MPTELREAAKLLGIDQTDYRGNLEVHYLALLGEGLPLKSLQRIASAIAPSDAQFKYRVLSKATLARRHSQKKLSPAESVIVTRLASIWSRTLSIWKSPEEARGFLYRPHPLLEERRPIDLIFENEIGAELVRDVLGRLEHGSAV